jgi:hypothetical protein
VNTEGTSDEPFDREAAVQSILDMQAELDRRSRALEKKQTFRKRVAKVFKLGIIHLLIGRKLTRALTDLLNAVHSRKRPYLGTELAQVLEAINRKVMGYKRWLIIIGLLAALPGFISVSLLWQQNTTVEEGKINKIADLRNNNRVELLITIYHTTDKSESGLLTTPFFSASNRRNAVYELIEWDAQRLESLEEADILNLNRMVDLSVAPLNDIDFSAIPGESPFVFKNIGFVNSNFENTSFEGCAFERVWFSNAQLYGTNFRGARFKDVLFDEALIIGADFSQAEFILCNFQGAQFDPTTRWPEGFDPVSEGAIPMGGDVQP